MGEKIKVNVGADWNIAAAREFLFLGAVASDKAYMCGR